MAYFTVKTKVAGNKFVNYCNVGPVCRSDIAWQAQCETNVHYQRHLYYLAICPKHPFIFMIMSADISLLVAWCCSVYNFGRL